MACSHFDEVELVKPGGKECEECAKIGDSWVHLRVCQTCGITLCCNSSPNKHARQHFKETGHPVIASAEKGEYWMWCYVDRAMEKY